MNPWVYIAIGTFVAVDLYLAWFVVRTLVRGTWNGLSSRYPGRDAAPDAVAKQFQSFRVGMANFGGCVHVEVDGAYLHMSPAKALRWLGAERVSIPWEAIEYRRPLRGGKAAQVRIGPHRVQGPAWCLGLAAPDAEGPA